MRPHLAWARLCTGSSLVLAVIVMTTPGAATTAPSAVLVQPGRVMRSEVGSCTMGFLLRSRSGRVFVTSAGHCAPVAASGESVWPTGLGPRVTSPSGVTIGRFVYSRFSRDHDPDLSVFELRSGVGYRPAMCFHGGPTALYTATTTTPTVLLHYGHGEGVSTAAPERAAVALGIPRDTHVRALGIATPGDSGGAIETAQGEALGQITDINVGPNISGPDALVASIGTIAINRLDVQLRTVEARIHQHLTLMTAPLAQNPSNDCQ